MSHEKSLEEEIRKSVRKLKKGKAGGVCEISGELLKAGWEVVIKWLTVIYNLVWRTRTGREPSLHQSTSRTVEGSVETTERLDSSASQEKCLQRY